MEKQGLRLCLGCMKMIPKNEPFCHLCGFNAGQYQGNPRCLRLGQKLTNKYIIGKVIGEGGFGITYIGWDIVLEMPVAVKEYFPSNIASRDTSYGASTINIFDGKSKDLYEQGLQRYVKEAKNLSRFHYLQGIVSVRDFFYANATAYIVMEYIDGITMKEHMKKVGRIAPDVVLDSLKPIMESLVKIHETGIVHRDISPDNIMITKEGTVKLIDFGSARLTENSEKSLTVMLKRGFAPEEQYRSKGNQGPWTDVYAICATMYYMMAGKVPPEAMERLLTDELVPVEKLGLPIDERTAKAIDKGLAVRADDRWQSVQELMDALFSCEEIPPTELIEVKDEQEKPQALPPVSIVQKEVQSAGGQQPENGDDLFSLLNDYRGDDTDYEAMARKKKRIIMAAAGVAGIILFVALLFNQCSSTKNSQPKPLPSASSSLQPAESKEPSETIEPEETPVPSYKIPNLKNLTVKAAKEELNALGSDRLSCKIMKAYSAKIKKGRIISQSEKKGTSYTVDDKVVITVTVSKGEQLYKVPKVTGLTRQKAVNRLRKQKLKVSSSYSYSTSVRKGRVISQSVKKGKKVKKGTKITITVSRGAKPQPSVASPAAPSTPAPQPSVPSAPKPTKKPSSGGNWNDFGDDSGW